MKKQIILSNPDTVLIDLYFSQTNSTLLIAFIWVFMVFISFLWNTWVNAFDKPLKSSVLEIWVTAPKVIPKPIISPDLTIWKQVITIWWKEYTVEITPKF